MKKKIMILGASILQLPAITVLYLDTALLHQAKELLHRAGLQQLAASDQLHTVLVPRRQETMQ